MSGPRILTVDDEDLIRWSLKERLSAAGYEVHEAETGARAVSQCESGVDLVLLDYQLPDTDGLTLLGKIKTLDPDILVILMTGHTSVETAVEAMKQGAYDYVNKPFNLDEIEMLVAKALETTRLRREVKALRQGVNGTYGFDQIIGESPAMHSVKELLQRIAASPGSTVLLTGESGTGKDLAAKAIHYNSSRADGPFMNITCSTIAETLLESELFGHEKGAFTDAKGQKKGLLELSHGGTVFLDEIGEISPALQAKLLRFLEDRTLKRVGGHADIRVDVRVVAATNRNLEEAVQKREFREDLYYRLRVLPVALPPLRERRGDIPLLLNFYIDRFNHEFRRNVKGVTPEALKALEAHNWPGNIREFKNAVERAMLLTTNDTLGPEDFLMLAPRQAAEPGAFRLPADGIRLEDVERDLVRQALDLAKGNQTRAAALLGMNRDQIRYRIEKFGFDKPPN
ncbi:MAG: sigma-54-dependent Fis family transcriptional regulator [Deltaproteobacteria bacterium]|nr:sigma-54-dependent Fis family transcriptional regulator [Deltaproteobacteria bacterium]